MRLLLDTHAFLWFIAGDDRLSAQTLAAIRDPDNEVFLSVVAVWEAIIKHALGKLPLPASPATYLPEQRRRHRIISLSVDEATVTLLSALPPLHRDPFDRLLVCQALHHGMTIVTVDPVVTAYPVTTIR